MVRALSHKEIMCLSLLCAKDPLRCLCFIQTGSVLPKFVILMHAAGCLPSAWSQPETSVKPRELLAFQYALACLFCAHQEVISTDQSCAAFIPHPTQNTAEEEQSIAFALIQLLLVQGASLAGLSYCCPCHSSAQPVWKAHWQL